MAKTFCLYCNKTHDFYEWKYRHWPMPDGTEKEGWVCGKWVKISYPEFTTDSIKEDRKKYFKSTLQPYRDGQLSKEYVEAHGTKRINARPDEIRNAKEVWKDLSGHQGWKKSL